MWQDDTSTDCWRPVHVFLRTYIRCVSRAGRRGQGGRVFDVAGRHLNRLLVASPHASQNLHQVCEQGWTEGAGRKGLWCGRTTPQQAAGGQPTCFSEPTSGVWAGLDGGGREEGALMWQDDTSTGCRRPAHMLLRTYIRCARRAGRRGVGRKGLWCGRTTPQQAAGGQPTCFSEPTSGVWAGLDGGGQGWTEEDDDGISCSSKVILSCKYPGYLYI